MKRIADAAAVALDSLCAWAVCATFGAIVSPTALLITDALVAMTRQGHGVLEALSPLALGTLGLHPLMVAALFGGLLGWGYAICEELNILGRP